MALQTLEKPVVDKETRRSGDFLRADPYAQSVAVKSNAKVKQADLILVDGDPLEDIRILQETQRITVYQGGKLVSTGSDKELE